MVIEGTGLFSEEPAAAPAPEPTQELGSEDWHDELPPDNYRSSSDAERARNTTGGDPTLDDLAHHYNMTDNERDSMGSLQYEGRFSIQQMQIILGYWNSSRNQPAPPPPPRQRRNLQRDYMPDSPVQDFRSNEPDDRPRGHDNRPLIRR